jgi:hypothetical protein
MTDVTDLFPPLEPPALELLAEVDREQHLALLDLELCHLALGWRWMQLTEAGVKLALAQPTPRTELVGTRFLQQVELTARELLEAQVEPADMARPIAAGMERMVLPIHLLDGLALRALENATANGGDWRLQKELEGDYSVHLARTSLAPPVRRTGPALAETIVEALAQAYGIHVVPLTA